VVVLVLHLRPGFAVSWFVRRRTRGGRGCKVCGGAAVAVKVCGGAAGFANLELEP